MTRLENVIEQVKDARKVANRPWIFNDDGEVADNVMCCEVLDVLEELKEYEISVSDEWIENFLNNPKVKGDNTYNFSGNISNDLNMNYMENDDGEEIMVIMVHLFGDIRCGYSDYFAVKFDSMYEFYELESATQIKSVNDHMSADLNIFSDMYNVYDYEKQEDVGSFYCFELEDLLEEINNNN
jgi:hypothetical protein